MKITQSAAFKIHKLGTSDLGDFKQLISTFQSVFEMGEIKMPSDQHLVSLLENKAFCVFVAKLEEEVIGGLTSYVFEQYYSEQAHAYIYDLAVLQKWQRQGIGQKLIAECLQHYKDLGFEEVWVQADKPDLYALDFYRKTKPIGEDDVAHYYYRLNEWKNPYKQGS